MATDSGSSTEIEYYEEEGRKQDVLDNGTGGATEKALLNAEAKKSMTEAEGLEFADKMRQLVLGRREYFRKLDEWTPKNKGKRGNDSATTVQESRDLTRELEDLNLLEKQLCAQDPTLFNDLYKIVSNAT